MKRLVDTNILIYAMRKRPAQVLARLREHVAGDLIVSSITVAELAYGCEKSARPQSNRSALHKFLTPFDVASFDGSAGAIYGSIRANLERRGTPIGPMDLLIAAHAMALGATLVTHNTREFDRVDGLSLEDWA